MEKILIHFNEDLAKKYLQEGYRAVERVNNVIQCYNELQIGDFNQEVFDKLLKQGSGFVEVAYEKDLDKQLKAFKNRELRNNILKGTNAPLARFKESFQKAFQHYSSPRFPLNLISIVDNKATLTQEKLDELKATVCSIYVSTEEEREVYAALMALKDVYDNTLIPVLAKYNYLLDFHGFGTISERFVEYTSKHEIKINPYCIETILSADQKRKEYLKELAERAEEERQRQSKIDQSVHIHTGDNPTPFFVSEKEKRRYFNEDFPEHKNSGLI